MKQVIGIALQLTGWLLFVAGVAAPLLGLGVLASVPWFFWGYAGSIWFFFVAPLLLVPTAFGLLLAGAALRKRRFRSGVCRACGYQLRVPAAQFCPECGTTV